MILLFLLVLWNPGCFLSYMPPVGPRGRASVLVTHDHFQTILPLPTSPTKKKKKQKTRNKKYPPVQISTPLPFPSASCSCLLLTQSHFPHSLKILASGSVSLWNTIPEITIDFSIFLYHHFLKCTCVYWWPGSL